KRNARPCSSTGVPAPFTEFCRNYQDKSPAGGYHTGVTIYEQVQQALDYIECNLSSPLCSSKTSAARAHMSVRSFSEYFWAITGFTFKAYVVRRRLSESLTSIRDGRERIVEIAIRSGYESHEAFTRAFKKEFGLTPIQCRTDRR